MSLTLKGYDLFSVDQFRAALQEARLPSPAERADFGPAVLASLRSLQLGDTHEAVAASLLQAAASSPDGKIFPTQLAEVELELKLICDGAGIGSDCEILPQQRNVRGVEAYSG